MQGAFKETSGRSTLLNAPLRATSSARSCSTLRAIFKANKILVRR